MQFFFFRANTEQARLDNGNGNVICCRLGGVAGRFDYAGVVETDPFEKLADALAKAQALPGQPIGAGDVFVANGQAYALVQHGCRDLGLTDVIVPTLMAKVPA